MDETVFRQNAPRFFSRIGKIAGANPICWVWHGRICKTSGYPMFLLMIGKKEKLMEASRAAWWMYRTRLDRKERLTATCGNILCVNPQHMLVSKRGPVFRKNDTRTKLERVTDLFWEKTTKKADGCWLFSGALAGAGYGILPNPFKNKKVLLAHRFSLMVHRPDEKPTPYACHHCDIPNCVNPNHLYWGTAKTNMQDRAIRKRQNMKSGEDNCRSKLTNEQVLEIVRIYSEQYLSSIKIGKMFGVHSGTIQLILNGSNWSSVTGIKKGTNNSYRRRKRAQRTVLVGE